MDKSIIIFFIATVFLSAGVFASDNRHEKKEELLSQYIVEDFSDNKNLVSTPSKEKNQKGGFLSNRVLYQTMLADPKKLQYSIGIRFKDTAWLKYEIDPASGNRTGVVGADHMYWTFSFGDRFGLYLFDLGSGHSLQVEIAAGLRALFSILENGNPIEYATTMINADYYVGIPITYSWNDFSMKFTFYHESSHLGDEFMKYAQLGHVFTVSERVNPSTEVLEIYFSYNIIKEIRIYSGIGVHLTADSSYSVKPVYINYGLELRPFDKWVIGSQAMLQLFAGVHMRTIQDTAWEPDITAVLGLEIIPTGDDTRRRIRLYGEYHYGYSVEGQFSKNKTDYFNVMLAFGF